MPPATAGAAILPRDQRRGTRLRDIIQIRARIEASDVDRTATDAWIYLGIAGRELRFNPGSGNGYFERGVKTCFVLGEQGGSDGGEAGFTNVPVEDPEYNDPRAPQFDTEDLDLACPRLHPLRFGGQQLGLVRRTRQGHRHRQGRRARKFDNLRLREKRDHHQLWLHERYGERLFLYEITSD